MQDQRSGVPRTFTTSWTSRTPGPIGCLAMLVLLPIGIVAGAVMLVISLFRIRRAVRAATAQATGGPSSPAREGAVRRLVEAFAEDESFTADEVRQAGIPVETGATADELLLDAIDRGWIEVRGERLAVSRRGRDALRLPSL